MIIWKVAKKETVIDKILKSVYTIFINRLIKGIIFAKEGIKVVTTVGTMAGGCKNVFTAFKSLLSEKIERNKAKGINR